MSRLLGVLLLWSAACGEVVKTAPDAAVDPCENSVCECTASTESTDCGAHEYCNEAGPGRTCACVAGYADGPSGCVWTGAIQDPAIAMQTVWTPANGALLNPTATGGVDPGEASFVTSAICGLGHIKQTIEMPTFAKGEQLVLELSYKNQLVSGQIGFDSVLMGVAFGGSWTPLRFFNDAIFHTERICLGERAYAPAETTGKGGPVAVALGPYAKSQRCPSSLITNFAIDHAQIVTPNAGECGSMPGVGPNFDAEGTTGWTLTATSPSTAAFVGGIGLNGSRAVRLLQPARCDSSPLATHAINVLESANPAIEMFVGSSGIGASATSSIASASLSILVPAGAPTTVRACLPPSLRGMSTDIRFVVSNSQGGLCSDVVNNQMIADNVRVIDDPTCGSTAAIANPSFEQVNGAVVGAAGGGYANGGQLASGVAIRSVANVAHTGTRYLALESYARCSNATFTASPVVPASVGSSGPAFTFWSNIPANVDATTTVRASGATASTTLGETGAWVKNTVCLDPLYVGRPQPVIINHSGGSGSCDIYAGGTQPALIDDLEVTTDPTCPAM